MVEREVRLTHRERLAEVLADGKWHRARDICRSRYQRQALNRLITEANGPGSGAAVRYQWSTVPVIEGTRSKYLRVVRRWPG